MLLFKRKLLRIWQCLWLSVVWQWCSSEVAASRKITIQTWQKLADIFVRVKHRAQRQIYQKNQYHELLDCHYLLITAARATLSPELLSWSCTGTWQHPKGKKNYRLQFTIDLAACRIHCLHLVKMQGTFCSPKEQIAELSAALPWTDPSRKWVVDGKSLYFGRQTWSPGQDQSSGEVFFVILICFLHFYFFNTATAVCVCLCAHLWCEEISPEPMKQICCSGSADLIASPKKPKGKLLFSKKLPVAPVCSQ